MPMIWFTSDLHFNHDREFIWKMRGFADVQEMNIAIIERYNSVIQDEDEVYILGDLMLGQDTESGLNLIEQLKGKKTIIRGNHDTDTRVKLYRSRLFIPVFDAKYLKAEGYHFYLSHYPTFTANLEKETLKQCTINLFGHTHQTSNFYNEIPFMYHVGIDSHNCYPVSIEQIISDMRTEVQKCKDML